MDHLDFALHLSLREWRHMAIGLPKSGIAATASRFRNATGKSALGKIAVPVLAIALILQVYFLRELAAAELLFGLAFALIALLVGIFYVVGTIGERGLDGAEVAARMIGRSARRGYSILEELGKKSLRHPESAR